MFWEDLGEVWESLGGFLGAFLEVFCDLEPNVKVAKNRGKPMVFSLIFDVPGGFWKSEHR